MGHWALPPPIHCGTAPVGGVCSAGIVAVKLKLRGKYHNILSRFFSDGLGAGEGEVIFWQKKWPGCFILLRSSRFCVVFPT